LPGVSQLMARLRELGADSLVITGDRETAALASRSRVPCEIEEFLSPIPYIIPGQLFAALLAKAKA
jgi:glucosamine--fructose-6-phosphate aminotransferase (isomerizing)